MLRIDKKYLDNAEADGPFRMQCYLSAGSAAYNVKKQLRCFFVSKCSFPNPTPTPEQSLNLEEVADSSLLANLDPATKELYQDIMKKAMKELGVVHEVVESMSGDEVQKLCIAYHRGATQNYLSAITDLYRYYGFFATRKSVENFSNGITIISVNLAPIGGREVSNQSISHVVKEISMLFCIPESPFHDLFQEGNINVQEMIYSTSCSIFAQHFLNRLGAEYWSIRNFLKEGDSRHQQVLNGLKKRLKAETFTVELLETTIKKYPELIKLLYMNFALKHYIRPRRMSIFSVSFVNVKTEAIKTDEELAEHIMKQVENDRERTIFECFLTFNKSVIRTNLYNPSKIAISFKISPEFLCSVEYPSKPFGMFLVVANEFRGFHIRFQDIARGGIRIIRSRNKENYGLNRRYLFDENYSLASTQNRKNKDIPEGGSKGTILLRWDKQDSSEKAFQKYIDALLDLLIKDRSVTSPTHPDTENEILFFGPDEGTADFMDWASLRAKERGVPFWKAITTGKSLSMGGIPHDTYGMTTLSVHQYVLGIYEKLGLAEETVTKLQMGGPDGDLGSNEIKISKDKTIAIVDGSGVLYDPAGIDREELGRLAMARKMISHFDVVKLGPGGFRVLVDEKDVALPDGTVVVSGIEFRNNFHLNPLSSADIFVPCGGRPESVDISNYQCLLSPEGIPKFKYVVEGANLFFTQDARIKLEQAGCIIFKDASANKGGVTSSSLEVLAALALSAEEFDKYMAVRDDVIPQFYQDYVREVQRTIKENASLEFERIWQEHCENPKSTKSEISDKLSFAMLELKMQLQEDDTLWNMPGVREAVLSKTIPTLLIDAVGGLEVLLKRLPENYQKAMFSSHLASRFVYQRGLSHSYLAFFQFITEYLAVDEQPVSDSQEDEEHLSQ